MRFFSRKTTASVQQHAPVKPSPELTAVVCSYPHRAVKNPKTNTVEIPTRVVFVKSTVEPDFRYVNFYAWHMYLQRIMPDHTIDLNYVGRKS